METEETLDQTGAEPEVSHAAHRRAGFVSGLMLGILVGAGFALLFAPEPGSKTRVRLKKRMRSLQEDAGDAIDRAGSRTRKQLLRRQRRLRAELKRVRLKARLMRD
jgi:gas vesicle protein